MRSVLISFVMLLSLSTTQRLAAAEVSYDHASFASALTAGKPVAVVFHAGWCPTCRAQAPVLKELMQEQKYQTLTLFVADFDTETALRKELGVQKQSTLVVFAKGHEVNRSTGDTQKDRLAATLASAGP